MINRYKSLLFALVVMANMFSLITRVYITWNRPIEGFPSLDELDKNFVQSFVAESEEIGWIKENKLSENYICGADFDFVLAQMILAPALLKNDTYTEKLVYNYVSSTSLKEFCQKNNYTIVRFGWIKDSALLRRVK